MPRSPSPEASQWLLQIMSAFLGRLRACFRLGWLIPRRLFATRPAGGCGSGEDGSGGSAQHLAADGWTIRAQRLQASCCSLLREAEPGGPPRLAGSEPPSLQKVALFLLLQVFAATTPFWPVPDPRQQGACQGAALMRREGVKSGGGGRIQVADGPLTFT